MFYDSLNDFVQSAIVLLSGGLLCGLIGRYLKLGVAPTACLFAWHTLLCIFFAYYVLVNGGDAFAYFMRAKFDHVAFDFGTEYVVWLTSFPVSWGMTYWSATFLYNVIGAVGLTFFFAAINESKVLTEAGWFAKLLGILCLLLPSLSFWTSGIGKDAIAFLAVGIFLWASLHIGRRQPAAVAAVLIMLGVRPHMAALMVLSVAAGTVFVAEIRATVRFSAAALGTAAAVFAVPFALVYAGTTQFTSLEDYISDRQETNLGGGSSVEISEMNPVMRLLSFMYRPLPNEAAGLDQLAASLDNVFLILLTLVGLVALYRAGFIQTFRRYSIASLFGAGGVILLSQVTANLGLASRQKWMAVPALMLVALGALRMAAEARAQEKSRRYQLAAARALR